MGSAPGQNAGISGYVSFPNVVAPGKWLFRCYLVGDEWNLALLDDAGRGDGAWPEQIPGNASGTIVLTGEVMQSACPNPTALNGASGTLTKTYWDGRTEDVEIRVFNRGTSFKESSKENYSITITAQILDMPTADGFPGTQTSDTYDAPADKKLWTGMRKTGDPNGIGVSAAERLRVWGVSDTDAAEVTELESHFTDTTPYAGLKLLPLGMTRASANVVYLDFMWGVADTKQQIEFPGTVNTDDSSDLEDQKTFALVQNSSTPSPPSTPSGLKLVTTATEQITNAGLYIHRFLYGRRTNQEAIEFDGTSRDFDSSNLGDSYVYTLVKANATPAAPATPDGYVLLDTLIVQRHAASTGEKWIHKYSYGRVTRANQIAFGGTTLQGNSTRDLGQTSTVRIVNTTAYEPSTITPSDYGLSEKVIYSDSQQLTSSQGAYTGYWQHTFILGPNDRYDEITNLGLFELDPTTIASTGIDPTQTVYDTADTSTFPSTPTPSNTDLQLISKARQRIQVSPEKWRFVWKFGRNTRQDQLQHTARAVDPNNFGESEKIPVLHTSASSSPGTPSPVNTTQLVGYVVDRLCVANGSFTGLWLWSFEFGPTTKKQQIEQQGVKAIDPAAEDDDDVQTLTNTSSTDPGAPGARISGQVLVRTEATKLQNTPEKWEFKYVYGWRTSSGTVIAGHTRTMVDISALENEAQTGERWLVSGGAPSLPTLSGYQLISYEDVEGKNPLYRYRFYQWGLLTNRDKRVLPHVWDFTDPSTVVTETRGERAGLDAESITAPTFTGALLIGTRLETLVSFSGATHTLTIKSYGLIKPQNSKENARTRVNRDPLGGMKDELTTLVYATGTSAQSYAGTIQTSSRTIPSWSGTIVAPSPDAVDVYEVTQQYDFEDIKIHSAHSHSTLEQVRGVPSGGITGTTGTAAVLTPGNVSLSDTSAWVRVYYNFGDLQARPILIYRTHGGFMIRRIWNVTATDLETKLFLAVRGCINHAAFLGYSAGEVMYTGPAAVYLYTDSSTAKRAVIDYEFETDDWKFFIDGYLPSGTFYLNSSSITVSGWYTSDIMEDGYGVGFPNHATFTGFIT